MFMLFIFEFPVKSRILFQDISGLTQLNTVLISVNQWLWNYWHVNNFMQNAVQ